MRKSDSERTRQKWKRWLGTLMAVLPLMVVGAGAADADSSRDESSRAISDDGIQGAIEAELLIDPGVRVEPIDVTVEDGIVRLDGSVNSILAKDRAAMIAGQIRGVRAVIDDLEVDPALRLTDAALQENVDRALLNDAATDSYEIDVEAEKGRVSLTGSVDSWQEKELAGTVAKSVYGVRELDNELRISAVSERPDSEIAAEVEAALKWDALVDDHLMEVGVEDGVVTLSGTVGSWAERFRAIEDAWIAGVTAVDADGLEIESWARDRFLRRHPGDVNDQDIEDALDAALAQDPRIAADAVRIQVDDSQVVLRGTVDHLMAKRAAEQIARNTTGVDAVENRLRVDAETVEGSDLSELVVDALHRDPWVERYEIAVSAEKGRVYLDGVVDSRFEKARADDVAARVDGVELVVNRLDVDADRRPLIWDPFLDDSYSYGYDWWSFEPQRTLKSDSEIERNIESQLFWSPFVDADEVTVTVDDGVAKLSGTVDSWSEWRAARTNAFEGGAVWVDNDLGVSSDVGASGGLL